MINSENDTIPIPTDLVKKLEALPKPAIIAIGGFGGSGKTSLANAIHSILPSSTVVSIDDFIVKEKLTEPSWDTGVFDRDRLERQVLKPARSGLPVRYERLIWATNTLEPVDVPLVDYLIVEGISSYHPNIAHYYDFKIWVEAPMEIAKQRGRARDGSNENAQHWDLWAANDIAYQQEYHPEQAADFIFKNG